MSSNGIEGLIVETHNWGKSVAFWRDLGYDLEHSLVLRHPARVGILTAAEPDFCVDPPGAEP